MKKAKKFSLQSLKVGSFQTSATQSHIKGGAWTDNLFCQVSNDFDCFTHVQCDPNTRPL